MQIRIFFVASVGENSSVLSGDVQHSFNYHEICVLLQNGIRERVNEFASLTNYHGKNLNGE